MKQGDEVVREMLENRMGRLLCGEGTERETRYRVPQIPADEKTQELATGNDIQAQLLVLSRAEYFPVFGGRTAEKVMERGAVKWSLAVERFVYVVEALTIRSKGKAAQVAARQSVRQGRAFC